MRKKIIAGNWKMNLNFQEAKELIAGIKEYTNTNGVEVVVAPASPFLQWTKDTTINTVVQVAAQNMHQEDNGAFTGEISADMLQSIGIQTVILGHSERRLYFGETDKNLAVKVKKALAKGMQVIFCNGETLEERKAGDHFKKVEEQTRIALFNLSAEELKNVVIAYEPVWAIGTGETASPEQAQEMHAHLRKIIAEHYTNEVADSISILYGGSVKPTNAKEIFSKPDVDGGLIGGAALKVDSFTTLIKQLKN